MASFFNLMLLLSGSSLMVQATEMRLVREEKHPEDDFLLLRASSECPKIGDFYIPQCSKYDAKPLDAGCWCNCDTNSRKSQTFFEPNNTCVPVNVARQISGCDLLFADETRDSLLTFFPTTGIRQRTVNVPANKTCSLQYEGNLYVQYLACDGSWKQVPPNFANDSLEVTPGWKLSQLNIRTRPGATFLASNSGRIFRMSVQCRSRNEINVSSNSSTCVMFKVEGRVTCPIPQQSPTEPSATLPQPVAGAITISTATLPPLIIPVDTTKTATKAPTDKVTEGGGETTKRVTERSENPRVVGESGAAKTSKKNTFIIAGGVAGGILLIALIVLILWRCNSPRKRHHPHSRLDGVGSISSPISQMSRHSIPVYTDAAHFAPIGSFSMRTNTMDSPTYRRGSDGIILGPDFKRGSIYSDHYPTSPPPRPPSSKRSSINGHVNPGLTLREEIVTMNPLFEGQIVEHKDLDPLNCSDFAVHPDQIVLEDRKNPADFIDDNDTYDCPEEILKGKAMTSTPVPVFYVVDDPFPDSISNTFRGDVRGRPDGHVYDEPQRDISRREDYVVMNSPNAVGYTHGYDEPRPNPNHGILKVGSMPPNSQRYDYDDGHMQVI